MNDRENNPLWPFKHALFLHKLLGWRYCTYNSTIYKNAIDYLELSNQHHYVIAVTEIKLKFK